MSRLAHNRHANNWQQGSKGVACVACEHDDNCGLGRTHSAQLCDKCVWVRQTTATTTVVVQCGWASAGAMMVVVANSILLRVARRV